MALVDRIARRSRQYLAQTGINLLRASGAYSSYFDLWRLPDLFEFAESRGIHVLPAHFYTPIPTKSDLQRQRRPNSLAGLAIDIDKGARSTIGIINEFAEDVKRLIERSNYSANSDAFCPLDAAVLYSLIRKNKPAQIIEIGSGMSTVVMLEAIADGKLDTQVTCVEPYPKPFLKARERELHALFEKPLQEIDLSIFETLQAGDVLFVDSTHVVRFDSDVVYEILEILPRVKPGVLIHVHDIFLPLDYPQKWLAENRFFWAEQYMLQAFLSMNTNFRVEIPLHAAEKTILQSIKLPTTDTPVTSFWLRRI